jgi:hypothetical protein
VPKATHQCPVTQTCVQSKLVSNSPKCPQSYDSASDGLAHERSEKVLFLPFRISRLEGYFRLLPSSRNPVLLSVPGGRLCETFAASVASDIRVSTGTPFS